MTDLPVDLDGSTLIVGPSGVGKTKLTARALEAWLDRRGHDGVVVLEFGPEIEDDGRLVGGRLDRFVDVPDSVWSGVLDAHAPRLEGDSAEASLELARANAEGAATILDDAPEPRAVFVNDATIALQADANLVDRLTSYCDRAECAVVNAYRGTDLGTDDPVSRAETAAIESLTAWADQVCQLP